jgi:hypothetical protein
MAETTPLIKKLLIKPNYTVLLLNAPKGYNDLLGALPEGVTVTDKASGQYDVVQLFVLQKADLEAQAADAMKAVKKGGLMWMSYPKLTGKIKSDLNRDIGNEIIKGMGWEGVTIISIDDTWSALRFKPMGDVKKK